MSNCRGTAFADLHDSPVTARTCPIAFLDVRRCSEHGAQPLTDTVLCSLKSLHLRTTTRLLCHSKRLRWNTVSGYVARFGTAPAKLSLSSVLAWRCWCWLRRSSSSRP